MKSVGIDIGSSSIKIAEISNRSKGAAIDRLFEHSLNPDPNRDSELEVLEFLRKLVTSYDPTDTRFILGIKQELTSGRLKSFPFKEKQKILRSLPFELEEDIPFSQNEAVFDAKIIQTQGPTTEVYACACPKEEIQNTLNFCQDMQITPHTLSIDGMSLGNLVEKWQEPPADKASSFNMDNDGNVSEPKKELQAILNIGHLRSLIVFYDKETQTPVSAKSILWGGQNIIEAISKNYDLPYIEAVKEVKTKSFVLINHEGATEDQVTFSNIISESINDLGRSLRLFFMDIQSEFHADIKALYFTGGASQVRNLGPYLTQQLEIPCNTLRYLSHTDPSYPKVSAKEEAKFSIALGLAIEGLKTPRNPAINFLKEEFAQQSQAFKIFWEKWRPTVAFAATALLIFFVYATIRQTSSESLNQRTDTVVTQQAKSIAKLSSRRASNSNIRKFINNKKSIAKKKKQLQNLKSLPSALDVFKKINDSLPDKRRSQLDITHVEIKDNNIAIQGHARRQDIPLIKRALTKLSSNKKIKSFNSLKSTSSGKAVFAFKFKYNRKSVKQ